MLKKLHFAILNKDHDKFMECYQIPANAETKAYLEEMYTCFVTEYDFVAAIEKAYGPEGVVHFTDLAGEAGMITFRPPPLHSPWWESKLISIRVNGDEAKYNDPYVCEEMTMAKVGGAWKLNPFYPRRHRKGHDVRGGVASSRASMHVRHWEARRDN